MDYTIDMVTRFNDVINLTNLEHIPNVFKEK